MVSNLPAELENIILNDPKFIKIHYPENWRDVKINLDLFHNDQHKQVIDAVRILKEYLRKPYLEDTFENNHSERRDWQMDLEKRFGDEIYNFFNADALKGGFAYFLLSPQLSRIIKAYNGSNKNELENLVKNVYQILPDKVQYNELKTSEKINLMRSLKKNIHNLLSFISL